jgi:hypothetical protein
MGNDSEAIFGFAGVGCPAVQRRPEPSLVLGEGTLDMPSMAIKPVEEAAPHLATVFRAGPATAGVAGVERDQGRTDAQSLAGQPMVVLTVEAGIGQQAIDRQAAGGLLQTGGEFAGVAAGTPAERGRGPQVGAGMTDHGQLGPMMPDIGIKPLAADDEMTRNVVVVQTGGIDAGFGSLFDQAACVGNIENGGKEGIESPFFRSRSWAYLSVE